MTPENPEATPYMLLAFDVSFAAATAPVADLAIAKAGAFLKPIQAAKEIQFTKSNLQLGREMHSAYKADVVNNCTTFKEFRLPSGKRIDYLDIENGLIHELKPFNPRAMKAGEKQLQLYKTELESLPEYQGISWKTILDTY
jgi:hypothetical protein